MSAQPEDLRWDDVIVSEGNGAAVPQVMVRSFFDKEGRHRISDVFIGGWALRKRYATREGAMARAAAEVELARTQRRGHW